MSLQGIMPRKRIRFVIKQAGDDLSDRGRGRYSGNRFTIKMQRKLVVLFLALMLIFAGLSAQLYLITRDSGEEYKQKVLSQQEYDSTTILLSVEI